MQTRRRYLLTSAGIVVGALSGCTGSGDGGDEDGSDGGDEDDSDGGDEDDSDGGDEDGSDGGDGGATSGQCDPSVIEDDTVNTVRWEGVANGSFEIESVDLTLTNLVDFPISVMATIVFYGEGGATDITATTSVNTVLEPGESEEFEITKTGFDAKDWGVELDVSCP